MKHTFRPSFPQLFAAIGGLGLGLGLGLVVGLTWRLPSLELGGALLLIATLIAAPWSVMLLRSMRVELDADGVEANDLWGLRRGVRWDAVYRVKPLRFLNLRYLRLYPEDRTRPVWLPLFLGGYDNFVAAVQELTPEGNPARAWLLADLGREPRPQAPG